MACAEALEIELVSLQGGQGSIQVSGHVDAVGVLR